MMVQEYTSRGKNLITNMFRLIQTHIIFEQPDTSKNQEESGAETSSRTHTG